MPEDRMWIPGMQVDGKVETEISPRSYKVSAPYMNCYEDIPEPSSLPPTEYSSVATTPSTTETSSTRKYQTHMDMLR